MFDRLTVVTVPPLATDLTTLDTIKGDLNITTTTDDAYLGRLISRASSRIDSLCNRKMASQTYLDTFRRARPIAGYPTPFIGYNLQKALPLDLGSRPVSDLSEVIADGTTLIAGTDYEVEIETGLLYRIGGTGARCDWQFEVCTVAYTAGWVVPMDAPPDGYPTRDLPDDLEEAAGRLIVSRYKGRGRDPELRRQSDPGVGEQLYFGGPGDTASKIPPEVMDMLAEYIIPVAV